MAQKRFGSKESTGRKLDVIEKYLTMYQLALKNTSLQTIYIDGFAGSGEIPLIDHDGDLFDEDVKDVMAGSADRALNVSPPFARYIFIDKRKKCIDSLRERFKSNANAGRVEHNVGDANRCIKELCASEKWKCQRGAVLLDPFGSQVEWSTIEAIANTRSLDLWYLFPAGVGVFRQIGGDGTVDPTHEPSITRIFGTEDWKTAFIKPSMQRDLFAYADGGEKVVTPESAAQFMIERMRGVFGGGVLDESIPSGKHSYPSYFLLFAWGNPSEKATKLARKLSKAAVRASDRKHGGLV